MEETNMRSAFLLAAMLSVCLFAAGCGSGIGNPLSGGQFDVGLHHISFSHSVAEWDTTNNRLVLKFDLLSGAKYPYATATVEGVTTIKVDQERDVVVQINIAAGMSYESTPALPGATAKIIFSQFDLGPLGAVSGEINGMAQRIEDSGEAPVILYATFEDAPVSN